MSSAESERGLPAGQGAASFTFTVDGCARAPDLKRHFRRLTLHLANGLHGLRLAIPRDLNAQCFSNRPEWNVGDPFVNPRSRIEG